MADERELPTGRLQRMAGLARVAARSGVALLGRGDGTSAAEQAAQVLGRLRGLAAKVGQMASYVDGLVPDGQSAAYARALGSLQAATPPSPFPAVQSVIESELGEGLSRAFAVFEPEPFASASIGQVHRAELHDGREVAVKVQHPGVAEAVEADLKGAGTLASFAAMLAPRGVNADEVFEELAARFREELDYRREARAQESFAALHAGDRRVHVPRVIHSHSRARVLTSELVRAEPFEAATRRSPEERKALAELLWHFVFKSILHRGTFNADPHPGNYLFHADGRVSFLDFGCVQVLAPVYVANVCALHRAAIADDFKAFSRAARAAMETREGDFERTLHAYMWGCYEPLRKPRVHLTRDAVAARVRDTGELRRAMLSSRAQVTPIAPAIMLLNRLQFGFWSVLARLDVAADYAAVHSALLASAPGEERSSVLPLA
jgi:predicted unusual protein kinase regulating ubiquinone biosynthesis (AarF/ABC1/UbiB family)